MSAEAASARPVTGERVVLCHCADPARDAEFNAWYDAYAVDILYPQILVNVRRYQRIDSGAESAGPQYLALYDVVGDDLPQAWPLTRDHAKRPRRDRSPLLDTTLAATFARQAQRGRIGSPRAEVMSLFVDPGTCADAGERLDGVLRAAMNAGAVAGGWRSANVEEDRTQPQAMLVMELARPGAGPLEAVVRKALSGTGMIIRHLDAYRPIFSAGY